MRRTALLLCLLGLACTAAPLAPTTYLLRAPLAEASGRVDAPAHVSLGRVAVAPYLRTSGIVVETEPGQLRTAREHQWAEPLEAGLRSSLAAGVSRALGYAVRDEAAAGAATDWRIDVHFDRLHGTMQGAAVVDARYRIAPRDGAAVDYRFARSAPLPHAGYAGLVEAEGGLVRELSASIAASLRELGAP